MDMDNIKIVKVTAVLAIPANMQGEDVLDTAWAKVLVATSEDYALVPSVVTEEQQKKEKTTKTKRGPGRPKGKKDSKPRKKYGKRKSKQAKKTKKAMKNLKENKKVFTHAMYGWNVVKDGSLVPNWKEQNNINWMNAQLDSGESASAVARKMVAAGIVGKKGGNWNASSVLRVVRNVFHESKNEADAPKWYKSQKNLKLR
tara:strand:- start:1952 stop:2551 length:600 start_codon:yes stop_codon:yes gene_type:complete